MQWPGPAGLGSVFGLTDLALFVTFKQAQDPVSVMLDSSPVALPPPSRPLKRSASVASLPTPPGTRHRVGKKREKATGSLAYHSESDSGGGSSTDSSVGDVENQVNGCKRRRTLDILDDEEAFWLDGGCTGGAKGPGKGGAESRALSEPATRVAPVSPPPSHRKTKRVDKASDLVAVRHADSAVNSPNNPFLDDGKSKTKATSPCTPTSLEERPTVTYVFRGVRGVYPNPLYNHAKKRALSPPPESLLPPEHPDYSPDMRCPPRVLFPTRPSKSKSHRKRDCLPELPTTPTRSRGPSSKERGHVKQHISRLPKMNDAVLGPGPKSRRTLPLFETLGESDDGSESADNEDGDGGFVGIKPIKLDFGIAGDAKDVKCEPVT
ncbi:hypothetical protein APHAL10511_000762 [Amanita phalloides]|nr:hypothetical protein APHAL10511_000762 [Amanita phalloides]